MAGEESHCWTGVRVFDADYFLHGLKEQVGDLGGSVVVNFILHSSGEFYVRDVLKTHGGFVMLNVWHGQGIRPIVSSSSSAYSDNVPSGYHPVSISYESISLVDVVPTDEEIYERIGYIT